MTLKFDDNRCCRIHSISDDGNGWIVTSERYVVMPWKMVTRHGRNITLAMGYLVVKNPRLKNAREERENEKKLKGSIRNTMRPI